VFYVFRCVLLHFSLRACFRSRDLFYRSVTSRQCALISSLIVTFFVWDEDW